MKELQFNVTVEEANIILEGLGKLPFERVFNVVGKLQNQANEQMKTIESNGSSNGTIKENQKEKIVNPVQ